MKRKTLKKFYGQLKIILILVLLVIILLLAIFGTQIKEKIVRAIATETPGYECGGESICTTCILEGSKCACGETVCVCGNMTVGREECVLL